MAEYYNFAKSMQKTALFSGSTMMCLPPVRCDKCDCKLATTESGVKTTRHNSAIVTMCTDCGAVIATKITST